MTSPLRERGVARVREFAASWDSERLQWAPTPAERELIEEAVLDYLLAESALATPAAVIAQHGLGAIDVLGNVSGDAGRVAATNARTCIVDLASRLDNQEDLNLAMREHLIILSEELRQLRTQL